MTIEKTLYFVGCATIDDLPHVIVVGNSLVCQWISELWTFFDPRKIEIYIFPTAESKFTDFWEGNWKTLKTLFINRIILVPHSVCCKISLLIQCDSFSAGHDDVWEGLRCMPKPQKQKYEQSN